MLRNLGLLIALILVRVSTVSANPEGRLLIDWPAGWEYQPPIEHSSVVYLEARQIRAGVVRQVLRLAVIDTAAAKKPIGSDEILALVERLRDANVSRDPIARIAVVSFKVATGYYFSATASLDRTDDLGRTGQCVEGVLLKNGYLVNLTLRTEDANGQPAADILAAIDNLTIEAAHVMDSKAQ